MGELLDLTYTNIITSKVKKRHPTQSTSIIIRYPLGNTTVTRKKIAIVGEISSVERLDKIIVYINGNDIEEISFRELHESNFKNIPLEVVGDLNLGENTITISASNNVAPIGSFLYRTSRTIFINFSNFISRDNSRSVRGGIWYW